MSLASSTKPIRLTSEKILNPLKKQTEVIL